MDKNTMSFSNKVVIVTGGSSGIGAAIAILFAKEGAQVAIAARNQTKLASVARKCSEVGKPPLIITADVSKDDDLKKIIDTTVAKFSKIDVLVNNAGVLLEAVKIMDKNLKENYDKIMATNLRSAVLLTNLAAPFLAKTKGNIVNISSIAGTRPSAGYSVYAASKAAMNHFTKACASELSEFGIRVNSISPGPTVTDILDGLEFYNWEKLKGLTALNKVSKPEEIAELAAFVASEKGGSITGSDFIIDCGILMKWF